MIQLHLEPEESSVLAQVLRNYLSDLRMEIVSTESHDMREDLKREEAIIKGIIEHLETPNSSRVA